MNENSKSGNNPIYEFLTKTKHSKLNPTLPTHLHYPNSPRTPPTQPP
jgi:hypothetical protein